MPFNIVITDDHPRLNKVFSMPTQETVKTNESPSPLPCLVEKPPTFAPIDACEMFDASNLQPRQWLIPQYLLLGYISMLVAAGATGKSSLSIVNAVMVATGKDLHNLGYVKQANVLVINNEDDKDEQHRRLSAICQYFGISKQELSGRLFFESGYESKINIAVEEDGEVLNGIHVEDIEQFILRNQIKLLVLDPFVSIHQCSENDNVKMDAVVSILKRIASKHRLSILIVHHTRKVGGFSISGDAEAARGASAVKDACRIVYTLNNATKDITEKYDISPDEVPRIKLLEDAKTNFSLASYSPSFLYMESIQIGNGEILGVPRPYSATKIEKAEKPTPGQSKAKAIQNIAQVAFDKLGIEGGKIKATELYAEYKLLSGYAKSKSQSDFALLPIGSSRSHLIKLYGQSYRIFQEKSEKQTSPRYVHLQAND